MYTPDILPSGHVYLGYSPEWSCIPGIFSRVVMYTWGILRVVMYTWGIDFPFVSTISYWISGNCGIFHFITKNSEPYKIGMA
jgi:hypothetical protein